jgi:phage gp36-like protein
MAAYADAADLLLRYDRRTVGELLSDTGEPLTPAQIASDTKLAAILEDASGQVEAAMLCGKRYEPSDLAALTGNSLALLKKIVCVIAIADLFERRPEIHLETAKLYYEKAKGYLEDLRTGRNIFNLSDESAANASLPDTDGPTALEYETLNLLPEQMIRYFPNRALRIPTDR